MENGCGGQPGRHSVSCPTLAREPGAVPAFRESLVDLAAVAEVLANERRPQSGHGMVTNAAQRAARAPIQRIPCKSRKGRYATEPAVRTLIQLDLMSYVAFQSGLRAKRARIVTGGARRPVCASCLASGSLPGSWRRLTPGVECWQPAWRESARGATLQMNPRLVAYVGRNSGLIGSRKGTCHEKVLDRGIGRDICRWGRLRPNGLRRKPGRPWPAITGLCGTRRKRRRGTPRSCRRVSGLAVQRGRPQRRRRGHRGSALHREVAVRRGLLPHGLATGVGQGPGPGVRLLT